MTRAAHALRRTLMVELAAVVLVLATAPAQAADRTYRVQPGDTLYRIAHQSHITLDRLLSLNGLPGDATLKIGQALQLPVVDDSTLVADDEAAYQVQAGDNLYRIAERFGTTVAEVSRLNGLGESSILQIGQSLHIPAAAARKLAAVAAPVASAGMTLVSATLPRPIARPAAMPELDEALPADAPACEEPKRLPDAVYVCESRVRLRANPSMESSCVRRLDRGAKLAVVAKKGMWWQVKLAGSDDTAYVAGWVVSDHAVDAPSSGSLGAGSLTEARTSVLARPELGADRVGILERNDKFEVLKVDGEWAQVRIEGGTLGWLSRGVVKLNGFDEEGDADGNRGLVATAMTYLGAPYVRGGTSHGGVDCSGLVYAVCREHGISLPRTSSDMYGHGRQVTKGSLRPGDLVFFQNTYRAGISHVGIYVGNNNFIHAARPGRGVEVASLDEGYYQNHWAGAFRVRD